MEKTELLSRYLMQELSDGAGWLTEEECHEVEGRLRSLQGFAVLCCDMDIVQMNQGGREMREQLITVTTRTAAEWELQLLAFWHVNAQLMLVLQGDRMTRRTLRECVLEISDKVRAEVSCSICVGVPCGTLQELLERGPAVFTMTDYAVLTGRAVFFEEDLPEAHYDLSCRVLKGRLEHEYMAAIVRKEFAVACHCLGQIVQQELDEDIRSVRRLKNRLMAKVETAMQIMGIAVDDPNGDPEMKALFSRTTQARELKVLMAGVSEIYTRLDGLVAGAAQPKERTPKIVLDYLDSHYSDPGLDSTMTAEACSVSKSYVSRVVNQHGGSSFTDYVNALRIGAAKELLRTTDAHVDEISLQVGFTNRWTMLRAFHRFVGMTPQEYRSYAAGIRM